MSVLDEATMVAYRADIMTAYGHMRLAAMDQYLLDLSRIIGLVITDEELDRELARKALSQAMNVFIKARQRAQANAIKLREAAPCPIDPIPL